MQKIDLKQGFPHSFPILIRGLESCCNAKY
jgi:hypothetical protein